MIRGVLPLALALVLSPACGPTGPAGSGQAPAGEDACADARSQAELIACWTREARRVEERIAGAQESLRPVIDSDPALSAAIARAQQEWTEYRDAYCEAFTTLAEGGSARELERAVCRARVGTAWEAEFARLAGEASR